MSEPIKITQVIKLTKIILEYSEINNRANPPPPYSILNPETSSLSPSEKSKGVRFLSAIQQETQHKKRGIEKKMNQILDCI
jgi:hypothetical protein